MQSATSVAKQLKREASDRGRIAKQTDAEAVLGPTGFPYRIPSCSQPAEGRKRGKSKKTAGGGALCLDGTLDEPVGSALAEYRCAKDRLEVCCSFFFAGYWQAIAASAAAAGGGRSAQEEERLMLDGLSWRRLSCGTAWPWSRSLQWGRVGGSACTCWTRTGTRCAGSARVPAGYPPIAPCPARRPPGSRRVWPRMRAG